MHDVTTLDTSQVEQHLVGLAGQLAAGQCRFLVLLAEFDTRGGWAGPGMRSCAQWLAWRVGMDRRTAQEQLRVAHALTRLPELTAAFAAGRISYSKVRALTRVATPATETDLLDVALSGTAAHVERAVRAVAAAHADPTAAAAHRSVTHSWADDGTLLLRARLTPEQGAAVLAALAAYTEPTERSRRSAERPDPGAAEPGPDWQARQDDLATTGSETPPGPALDRAAARRADALTALAETALASPDGPHGIEPDLVVHLRAEDGTGEITGGPGLAPATVERLACGARARGLISDKRGNPLHLGRRRRVISRAQRVALIARDGECCRFPGCGTTRVDAHHIVPWLAGGATDLDNLVLLCRFHHGLIHDRGYRIAWRGGQLQFARPDGSAITPSGHLSGDLDDLVESYTHHWLAGDWNPGWGGEKLDTDLLLTRLQSAEQVEQATAA